MLRLSHTHRKSKENAAVKKQIAREITSKHFFPSLILDGHVYLCHTGFRSLHNPHTATASTAFLKHSKSHYFCTSLFCRFPLPLLQNQATSIHEKGNILYGISHHGCVTQSPTLSSLHQPPSLLQSISGAFFSMLMKIMESLSCAAWLTR